MLPSAVKELMGEPQSVEKVTTQNDFDTIQRDSIRVWSSNSTDTRMAT